MTTNPPADAAKVRLEQTIAQLSRMERNAAFGGAGTSVRVSDAPYLIQTLTLVQSSLAAQASQIEALTAEVSELRDTRDKAIEVIGIHRDRATAAEAKFSGEGWVYWNPDTGEEYACNHPIDSGECVEAENARCSTLQEDALRAAYQEEWRCRCAAEAKVAKMREALTPSGETKYAYMGEFSWTEWLPDEDGVEQGHERTVPWDTIKEIMKAIRERAGVEPFSDDADIHAALEGTDK